MTKLGIIVNPMSGKDVRRIAARASVSTNEHKQHQVTRLVLGAITQGVTEVVLSDDPFRISRRATENLPERDAITLIRTKPSHSAEDTRRTVTEMWDRGCRTFVALGGDGTHRIVAQSKPDAILLPLSTGTNNVFPYMIEASVAGAAAGIVASGQLPHQEHCLRAKRIHLSTPAWQSTALIDAAVIEDDVIGNLLPFEPDKLRHLFLARSEPASIGLSPIGGYLMPSFHEDDFGVALTLGEPAQHQVRVPISAGLYGDVMVQSIDRLQLDSPHQITGRGIVEFDGDREHRANGLIEVTLKRDGPWIIDPRQLMSAAVQARLLSR